MADNSSRWQRVASQSGDKPRFEARQRTEEFVAPRGTRGGSVSGPSSPDRSTLWWIIGVLGLVGLAGLLAWQLLVT